MENERIIERIKKVLALAQNNPCEEEAKSAALQAQKLLAKYHLSMAEVEATDTTKEDPIEELSVTVGAGKKWKYTLADVVAKNFRCKHFYYGRGTIVFYGHKVDTEIAAETFKYLFNLGHRLADSLRVKTYHETGSATGVYNSFVAGFCRGIQEALGSQCVALALVVPQDVKDSYKELTKNFNKMSISGLRTCSNDSCSNAYSQGKSEGKSAINRRSLKS